MSLEQHAFLEKRTVPSVLEWQAAIDSLGFDLQIDPTLTPFVNIGFLPCVLAGEDSGFEIYYETADELFSYSPHIKEKAGNRDYSISFRWGGNMTECACVLIASAALAKSFDALVYNPDDDIVCSFENLVSEAKGLWDRLANARGKF